MIGQEQLAALDLSLWFGSGLAASKALHVNQSTISRHVKEVLRAMELVLERRPPFCRLHGDLDLLQAERGVHQLARLKGRAPLRLDGTRNLLGMERPLELLEQRVIDAWVGSCSQPDLPEADDPSWWVLDLLRVPVQQLPAPNHPLAGGKLVLPAGWLPRTEATLRAQRLWREPVDLQGYGPDSWDDRYEDGVTRSARHDWNLGLIAGDTLIVRRDLMEHAPIQLLAQALGQQAQLMAGCLGGCGGGVRSWGTGGKR